MSTKQPAELRTLLMAEKLKRSLSALSSDGILETLKSFLFWSLQ
jgi:hypothetical protein